MQGNLQVKTKNRRIFYDQPKKGMRLLQKRSSRFTSISAFPLHFLSYFAFFSHALFT